MIDRTLRWLLAERTASVLYAVAALSGLTLAWVLLGWDGINGTSRYWETTHNDSLQGIAALRYYMAEPWSWSVFHVSGYGVPDGVNLILADSIPLLALPAKALGGLLPAGFHYFGYWMAFCFIMQAVAMVMLMVETGRRTMLAAIAGSGLALLQTAILTRFFHVGLMSQFVIVLAILLGVRLLRSHRPDRTLVVLGVLVAVVFFIHLYLFAMTLVVATAFVVQAGIAGVINRKRTMTWVAAAGAGTAALVTLTGVWGAAATRAGGLGRYSMNLLAPIAGNIDATGGQYEGFSYLGIGVLGLVAVALVLARSDLTDLAQRCWVPLLAVTLMAVFALSPTVWIGEAQSFDVPWLGLEWLGERFRSTGRFVWPLVYVSIAATLFATMRRFAPRMVAGLLLTAVLIQIIDVAPLVGDVREVLVEGEQTYLPADRWEEAIAAHELVRIIPQQCVVGQGEVSFANREVQRMTALLGVPVTAAAVARQEGDCDDPVWLEPVPAGELRIVWSAIEPSYQPSSGYCVVFDLGTACTASGEGPRAVALAGLGRED